MPMRFQSLDLNMGDNYVDKHRFYHLEIYALLNGLE